MKEESLVLVDTAVYEVVSSRLLNNICFSLKSSEKNKNHELCKSNSEIQIAKTCSHKPETCRNTNQSYITEVGCFI